MGHLQETYAVHKCWNFWCFIQVSCKLFIKQDFEDFSEPCFWLRVSSIKTGVSWRQQLTAGPITTNSTYLLYAFDWWLVNMQLVKAEPILWKPAVQTGTNTQILPLAVRKLLPGKAALCPSMWIDSKEDYTLSYQLPACWNKSIVLGELFNWQHLPSHQLLCLFPDLYVLANQRANGLWSWLTRALGAPNLARVKLRCILRMGCRKGSIQNIFT